MGVRTGVDVNKEMAEFNGIEVVSLVFRPLYGVPRIMGYPDAGFQNNPDKSSQRAHVIFIASERQKNNPHPTGALVDYCSKKIKKA